MRKSVIFLSSVILILIALVAFWSTRNTRISSERTIAKQIVARPADQTSIRTFPPPVSPKLQPSAKPASQVLQIDTQQSAELERQNINWRNARGCDNAEYAVVLSQSENTLRSWTLNNNLVAANRLAWMLLFEEPSYDGRTEAKKVLWQAMVQGSVCAIITYDIYWHRAHDGQREIRHFRGKDYVYYSLNMPKSDAAKRKVLMNDYAWDLVYEMRTGTAPLGGGAFRTFEAWSHFGFSPTAAEYAYACQRANDLYETLQSDREAQGLGPFDNTPQPLTLRFGMTGKPAVGVQCSHWPISKPGWQAAELHLMQHDGTINPFSVWLAKPEDSDSLGQNQ